MQRAVYFFLFVAVVLVPAARADRVDDLARIHVEALGGRERIAALKALRATGEVVTGGKRSRFTLIAARPNRIRLETLAEGARSLVQASDGQEPPWEFDTGQWPPRYVTMMENAGRTFAADAEFDDALVGGKARGFSFEYAGEVQADKRSLLRVLVKREPAEAFALLVDAETYMIAMRTEKRQVANGGVVQIVTRYDDYRPVDGVLLPHKVVVTFDSRIAQQTTIDSITANPDLSPETFTRPKSTVPPATEKQN